MMAFGSRYWGMAPVYCGCYYYITSPDNYARQVKHYLPLLDSQVHSTILSTTSRTLLTQTFTNPSASEAIKECVYVFPLYDGVSVVSFTCRIGNKVLTGLVKAKEKAKQIFDQAVARGETAGLLEQAPESSDVFSTKLGNIPAGQSVIVEITYVGELKHHETEGIRFTIPTKIAPRYGPATSYAVDQVNSARDGSGIKITVDVNMPEGSFIKGVQSPSHPIAVSMGTISTSSNSDPVMSKASATLALGSSALDKDFVLIVQSKDVGTPKALLETHPTIPNQRALMVTLVPKFSLPPTRPEIVFVADRSGSMQGNIPMLISAMNVFLKSMPAGVKFNICSFGSSYSFLWPKSESYTKESLVQASQHVQRFGADMGGTETFNAVKATIDRRYGDLPLEIILLTDGDISRQNELFAYVNQKVKETGGNVRVFPLGIGNGVSHALIEGLARAGDGFAQAVQEGERLDNSVVRMLRGALSPHIKDYTLEVKYEPESSGKEEIDFVTEGMKVLLSDDEKSIRSEKSLRSEKPLSPKPKATISLFDTTVDPEKEDIKGLNDSKFWLPHIPQPKLLQAPHKIPSLYAFSRTTVYLLMSEETCQRKPISVTLRGTSAHGPLELEIAVEVLAVEGETIHQLAAKKAVQDLEEGRGWIYDAKDQNEIFVKERYPSRFQDLVEQEAVRLGEKFQIAGKWCSFVAVAANDKEIEAKNKAAERRRRNSSKHELSSDDSPASENDEEDGNSLDFEADMATDDGFEVIDMPQSNPPDSIALNREVPSRKRRSIPSGREYRKSSDSSPVAAAPVSNQPLQDYQMQLMLVEQQNKSVSSGRGSRKSADLSPAAAAPVSNHPLQDYQMQMMLLEQQNKKRLLMARQDQDPMPSGNSASQSSQPPLVRHSLGAAPKAMKKAGSSYNPQDLAQAQQPMGIPAPPPPESAAIDFGSVFPAQGGTDVLQDFDFDSFLHTSDDPSSINASQQTGFQAGFQAPLNVMPSGSALHVQQPTGGLFGNATPSASGGLFGGVSQQSTGGGLFGASTPSSASGVFGSLTPQSTGSTNPFAPNAFAQPPSSGGFGASPSSNPSAPNLFSGPPDYQKHQSQLPSPSFGNSPQYGVSTVHHSMQHSPAPPPANLFGSPMAAKPFQPSSSFGSPPAAPIIGRGPSNMFSIPPPLSVNQAAQVSLFGTPNPSPWNGRSAAPISSPPLQGNSPRRTVAQGRVIPNPFANSAPQASYAYAPQSNQLRPQASATPEPNYASMSVADKVLALIDLQDFDGFWAAGTAGDIVKIFGWDWGDWDGKSGDGEAGRGGVRWITLLVIAWLEEKAAGEEGVWGLVVEKAKGWLDGLPEVTGDGGIVALERKARNEVRRH